jgi:CubicO group peptidase (beta-lactamase class C family)
MRRSWLCGIAGLLLVAPQGAQARPQQPSACTAARTAIGPERLVAARDVLRSAIARGFAPGAILLVERRGRIVMSEVTGLADAERKVPLRPDSLFRLYSMTKPVTTAAALQLAEQGRLNLDDPVSKYIPAFANTQVFVSGDKAETLKVEPPRRPVTIRDLMRHTAGMTYKADGPTLVHRLYAYRGVDTGSGADIAPLDGSARVASSADLANRIATIPLLHQPGTRFSYGNATDVLGHVVEVVSGRSLSDYLAGQIFGPLGMTDTGFIVRQKDMGRFTAAYSAPSLVPGTAPLFARVDPAKATPGKLSLIDDPARSPFRSPRPMDYGGAGLVGTAADYLRFTQALRQGGSLGKARILSRRSAASMIVNQLPADARTPELAASGLGFGLGLAVRESAGTMPVAFPQCGAFWAGAASTYFWIDPQNEVSGVLLTQVFGGDVRSVWLSVLDALYAPAPKGRVKP